MNSTSAFSRSSSRTKRFSAALAGATAALALFTASASADIFWAASENNLSTTPPSMVAQIGKSSSDGLTVNQVLVSLGAGRIAPGLAANSTNVFWNDSEIGGMGLPATSLGSALVDGTGSTTLLDPTADMSLGVAIDSNYIYFPVRIENVSGPPSAAIARANLNGTGLVENWLPLGDSSSVGSVMGVAVDSNYIYWSVSGAIAPGESGDGIGKIGRANLNGTGVNASFITGLTRPFQLAVTANYLFWGHFGTSVGGSFVQPTTVGRADVGGTNATDSFITGLTRSYAVAADSTYVYFGGNTGRIGRATHAGSDQNLNFIDVAAQPADNATVYAIATTAGSSSPPSNTFTVQVTSAKSTAITSSVTVPGAGQITQSATRAGNKPVCSSSKSAGAAGAQTLTCTVNAATKALLRKGTVKVTLKTTFTPTGGSANTKTNTVTLPKSSR